MNGSPKLDPIAYAWQRCNPTVPMPASLRYNASGTLALPPKPPPGALAPMEKATLSGGLR